MDWRARITFEPGKRSGKPCVRGLRITVSEVLEYLASGMTEDDILRDFPDLTRDDIRACLAFAADRERKISIRAAHTSARSVSRPPMTTSSGATLQNTDSRSSRRMPTSTSGAFF
ncbi:MAG: DUF433 domain-containing protein [candidate division NC10 bacterium]|nr:DUF433 domain-containing protein [candidate division NC10 bacterium]